MCHARACVMTRVDICIWNVHLLTLILQTIPHVHARVCHTLLCSLHVCITRINIQAHVHAANYARLHAIHTLSRTCTYEAQAATAQAQRDIPCFDDASLILIKPWHAQRVHNPLSDAHTYVSMNTNWFAGTRACEQVEVARAGRRHETKNRQF